MMLMDHTYFQGNQQRARKEKTMLNLENFKQYLINKGYKEYSANLSPSTAIDYPWRISKIMEKEGITLDRLSADIQKYIELYGRTGEKWCVGKRSHESYLNALRQFKKFISIQRSSALSIFKLGSSKY